MKTYFNFNKSQKTGIIVIVSIIVLQIVLLNYQNIRTIPNPIVVDDEKYLFKSQKNKKENTKKSTKKIINYHPFDPNKFTIENWVSFGFSKKQATSIISYKHKINGFKSKEDLKKVYVISDKKYLELEPYIEIKTLKFNKSKAVYSTQKTKVKQNQNFDIVVEINSANYSQLIKVVGIGEFTAKNIIKYKEKLGGFHSKEQLKEVYGITEENYNLIVQQININSSKISKIKVNAWSISKLKQHPYINWNIAESITNERLKGKLTTLDFLVDKNQLMTKKELLNLMPYIQF
ncbi:MAG TPA: helix-hairpin-helix domain-containing protein [Crocinitomix sp.]|nr:helix-hairpin-helix domain-containing protein [Crocinitomix sp.]